MESAYAQAYDSLLLQVKELQRNRFGKKSERFVGPEIPSSHLPADTLPDAASDDSCRKLKRQKNPCHF